MAEETKVVENVAEQPAASPAAKPKVTKKAAKAPAAKRVVPAKKAASPAKAPAAPKVKKAAKPSVPSAHPPYLEMVTKAVTALKERSGSSRQAILKYILANFQVCCLLHNETIFYIELTFTFDMIRLVLTLRPPIST